MIILMCYCTSCRPWTTLPLSLQSRQTLISPPCLVLVQQILVTIPVHLLSAGPPSLLSPYKEIQPWRALYINVDVWCYGSELRYLLFLWSEFGQFVILWKLVIKITTKIRHPKHGDLLDNSFVKTAPEAQI